MLIIIIIIIILRDENWRKWFLPHKNGFCHTKMVSAGCMKYRCNVFLFCKPISNSSCAVFVTKFKAQVVLYESPFLNWENKDNINNIIIILTNNINNKTGINIIIRIKLGSKRCIITYLYALRCLSADRVLNSCFFLPFLTLRYKNCHFHFF
jgi:hypothetical protein